MHRLTHQSLRELLLRELRACPAHALHLCVKTKSSMFCDAVGVTSRNAAAPYAQAHDPILIASVTKTFVAAAALRLVEAGELDLDAALDRFIDAEESQLLETHGYRPDLIEVRQLLGHTGGLFDYADTREFFAQIFSSPSRRWKRRDQLLIALREGAPYGAPGDVFRYSDTGYNFVGQIIESITGCPLGVALRKLLRFDELALHNTWFSVGETAPQNALPLLHQYDSGIDMSTLHPSFDCFGGGGLISTVRDMAAFMSALFEGQVFDRPGTLETMLTALPATKGGPDYGGWQQVPGTYGLGIHIDKEMEVFLHKGHFGTLAAYFPRLKIAVGLSTGLARTEGGDLLEHVFAEVMAVIGVAMPQSRGLSANQGIA